jgi:hypothetical protein
LSAETDLHGPSTDSASFLAELSQMDGVEFVLATGADHKTQYSWGVADTEQTINWMKETLSSFQSLGEHLKAGEMRQVIGAGPQRKVALVPCKKSELCVGFPASFSADRVRETMQTILAQWAS